MDGQDGSSEGIYGQRYDADGNTIGTEFPVNTTTADWQDYASITALTDGGFVVVWQSNNQDGNGRGVYGRGVYGRRFDVTGAAGGGEFQINDETYSHQSTPAVAARPDGGFIVTGSWHAQDASLDRIYAKVFAGPDRIANGSAGHDSLAGGAGDDILAGDAGDDLLKGGAGDDRLIGDTGSNHLSGGDGIDADNIDSGDGIDIADYAASGAAVTVNLATGAGLGGDAQGDVLSNVEDVIGDNADNLLYGRHRRPRR